MCYEVLKVNKVTRVLKVRVAAENWFLEVRN